MARLSVAELSLAELSLAEAPKPLRQLDASAIVGVLTDIDDTMTTDGQMTAAAYRAMCNLANAGLAIIPVTGRSAGWAHMVAKTWPVVAVVAESGGLYFAQHRYALRLVLHDDAAHIAHERLRLERCAARVMAQVPGLRPASDNAFRLVDLALDYCEEVRRVPAPQVALALAMFRADGFNARASSVHINAWSGQFDKAPMALRAIHESLPKRRYANTDRWLFVGDAPNDESMFGRFRNSVGVANIAPSLASMSARPRFITRNAKGAGFVELAKHLLSQRSQPD